MSVPPRLPRKPEARAEKVEDLVERVRAGLIRVPKFQRGLNWKSSNVVELFDSLYRGYPIGALLFYKRPAEAGRLKVGPLLVDAPETSEAWWVVDGQQRVTALAACLSRPLPFPAATRKQDPYILYFDAAEQKFVAPPVSAPIPPTWVPLPNLLDATQLTEWVFRWEKGADESLRRVVFEAGSRLREYSIPLYLIETEDTKVSEEIFYRVNQAGSPLKWTEVHKALFGGEQASPSTLEELATDLVDVGMGRLEESRLLTCIQAMRGFDTTRTLAEHRERDPDFLQGAVLEALPVLRRVLSFLRSGAEIPHLRLLPSSILLDVLSRFFSQHADPKPRTRLLLARWLWRTLLGAGSYDDRTLRRRGIAAITDSEEESVQRLLSLLYKERPRPFELPQAFDARADDSRIALLALAHLGPRHLTSGEPIDLAGLLESEERDAFAKVLEEPNLEGAKGLANRILQPGAVPVRRYLSHVIDLHGKENPILASHAIDLRSAESLKAGDLEGFLSRRGETITTAVRDYGERMAAWEHSDRPSLDYILEEAGVQL